MFDKSTIKALEAPLNATHVKTRQQAGRTLSYIEGWHAIAEANRIFGFDGWTREVELHRLSEPVQTGDKWRVYFMAKCRITAQGIVREGHGYGSGISKDLGDASEGAIKEAETDAMKRALMTFGNPFGLALYDKSQANVQTPIADEVAHMQTAMLNAVGVSNVMEARRMTDSEATPALGRLRQQYTNIAKDARYGALSDADKALVDGVKDNLKGALERKVPA